MADISSIKPGHDKDFQFRLFFFIILTIVSFVILIIIIANLQIIKNINYATQTQRNTEKTVRIAPIRGIIKSSDDYILADNITAFDIYINPYELYKDNSLRQQELEYLNDSLNISYADIENLIAEGKKTGSTDILIAKNIPLEMFVKIGENLDRMPGVTYKEVLYRNYPNKDTLSHVLGHIGPISSNDIKIYKAKGYEQYDCIGQNGIEKYYEDLLRGKPGYKFFQQDAKMKIKREIIEKEIKPEPGYELVLSINLQLQKTVEKILADRSGCIIVGKPATGEIIAMASYPDYDPNIYILNSIENDRKKRELLLNTKGTPLLNRCIQSIYPPGSVFKIVTATAVLNENIISTHDKFYCGGVYRMGRQDFKCWVYPAGHGWQNLQEGIMNSCDVYFYNAGLKVGPERINKYALSYNFGSLMGIDLPYEKEGLIPSIEWMESKGQEWLDGHTLNTVIGQGDVKVTPLQILNFMSVISNRGYSFKPHVLKEIRSSLTGDLIKRVELQKLTSVNYSNETFDFIINALSKVVTEGTAGRAFWSNKFKLAGKTGTAEVGVSEKKHTHSWFAGFGPLDYPEDDRIVVVVLVEYEDHHPFKYAAPLACMTFNAWLNKEDFEKSANRLGYPIKEKYLDNEVKAEE